MNIMLGPTNNFLWRASNSPWVENNYNQGENTFLWGTKSPFRKQTTLFGKIFRSLKNTSENSNTAKRR